jgi:hypothetical protein
MKPNTTSHTGHMRFSIAALLTALLAACSDSPIGPKDGGSSIHVSASAMTATSLGQSITIQASVVDGAGKAIADAPIRWELSTSDVLESLDDGRFRVLKEGSVTVTAVWREDSTIRAAVTVNVDAGLLASACVARSDQAAAGAAPKCAQRRFVVRTS